MDRKESVLSRIFKSKVPVMVLVMTFTVLLAKTDFNL